MEPVGSVTSAPLQAIIPPPPLPAFPDNPETYTTIAETNQEQADYLAARDLLLNQLPQEPARNFDQTLRSLNALTFQALEPGQNSDNREALQTEADTQLDDLRSLLSTLTQEDLALFTAVFENTLPQSLTDTGTVAEDASSTLSQDVFSNQTLENLFQIDITTESGSLAALDLINSLIDALGNINSNSNPLETLLDNLTLTLIDFATTESPSSRVEPAETSTEQFGTDQTGSSSATEDLTASLLTQEQGAETIFDLVG